jgi:hypothetical protein
MAQLTGNKIKDTYLGLLKTNGSGILTSGFQRITDGSGLGSQLYLSLTGLSFTMLIYSQMQMVVQTKFCLPMVVEY